ncbi:GTP-binding protein Di-Ras3 [Mustela erminea]|uniref:GTP-binding protein Di-Ras3 n=1 Tax=Mustela erminea TaxID=36723 RepID=UPI001386C249|nr:GTP-binding protein Di-Ras3 [Mustela erminea]XP_032159090.1 GTP-binding protein Di-Ras3 [Mustela erminea]
MGNNCFGFKKWPIRRLRPLPTLIIIPALMPQNKNKDCCVVLGTAGVGKSVSVQRWVRVNFPDAYLPTIADTDRHVLSSNHGVGALYSTEATGSPRYPGLQRLAVARGPAVFLVYSANKKQTVEELKPFYKLIYKVKDNTLHKYPIVLVDSKCQESRWESMVSAACALEWNCAFLETSAEMDISVPEIFHTLPNQEKMPAACLHHPQKKSLMPETAEKLLNKCTVMTRPCRMPPGQSC